jgi:alpha-ketoglutarate-dependent taurine dioxygenase
MLGIEAIVADGWLTIDLSYSTQAFRRESIEALSAGIVKTTRLLANHLRYIRRRNPANDFPLARIGSAELEQMLASTPDLEDVYPLTPAQQGILFQALYRPESGLYLSQFHWSMEGEFDADVFRQAWKTVLARHPALRTSFVVCGLSEPHQVVHRDSEMPFEEHDWRTRPDAVLEQNWQQFLREEWARRLDPTHAPMMRCALVQITGNEHRVVWTHHHALIDGWSAGIILRDVFMTYEAIRSGIAPESVLPPPPRRYRDFVAWLQGQSDGGAGPLWMNRLKGARPLKLPDLGPAADNVEDQSQVRVAVPAECCMALEGLTRKSGLTLNTLVIGAWAVVLSALTGCEDVIFGSVVAGRPAELDGVDEMVGLFVNTLPVQVVVKSGHDIIGWLEQIQREQVESRTFEHVSLSQIRRWSGLAGSDPLFDTAVVFENLPESSTVRTSGGSLKVHDVGSLVRNHFTLTLRAVPVPSMVLEGLYDPERVLRERVEQLLAHVVVVLGRIANNPRRSVDHLFFTSETTNRELAMSQDVSSNISSGPRVAVATDPKDYVRLSSDLHFPLLVEPAIEDLNLPTWLSSQRTWLDRLLVEHKAILLRGFGCDSAAALEDAMAAAGRQSFNYSYASTPRKHLRGRVFTSTEYPADQNIPMHNEMSYTRQWPARLWFACVEPAEQGGSTPIADSASVWRRIPEPVRDRFRKHGVMYTRMFQPRVDLSWRDVFHTESHAEVERYCHEAGIECEWLDAERLRTRQVCQSEIVHPDTGETVWFNQAHLFHISSLSGEIRAVIEQTFSPEERPRDACFGDGSPIPEAILDEVRAAYAGESITFAWEKGDVLLLDNVAAAHGRTSFRGCRQIAVGMSL